MERDEAGRFVLRFGRFSGSSLEVVQTSDDGLRYLDWLRGQDWIGNWNGLPAALEGIFDEVNERRISDLIGD